MASTGILDLPPELLDHIVAFLPTVEPRRDIAACRLVCRQFKDSSSPHLFQRVVFATRFKDIAKLQWIVNHPYFSHTITEFIYDGSTYEEELATDFDEYTRLCEDAEVWREMEDEEWVAMKLESLKTWEGLQRFASETGKRTKATGMDREVVKRSEQYFAYSRDGRVNVPGLGIIDIADLRKEDPYGLGWHTDQAFRSKGYRLGCHKTWPVYRHLYREQEALDQEGMVHGILVDAFIKLTALRSVVHSDFRYLIREGESYDTGCKRMFGNALEPKGFNNWGDASVIPLIIALNHANASITSFTAGHHPFEFVPGSCTHPVGREFADGRNPRPVLLEEFNNVSAQTICDVRNVLAGLTRLDLFLACDELIENEVTEDRLEYIEAHTSFGRLLQGAVKLTHLTIAVADLGEPHLHYHSRMAHGSIAGGWRAFDMLLADCTFPHLRYLHLAGWVVSIEDIQKFLLKHKSTLRQVRLIYNMMFRGYSRDLALWAGELLPALQGVEICNSTASNTIEEAETPQVVGPLEYEEMWLDGRPNCLDELRLVPKAERLRGDGEEDDDESEGDDEAMEDNYQWNEDQFWWKRVLPW